MSARAVPTADKTASVTTRVMSSATRCASQARSATVLAAPLAPVAPARVSASLASPPPDGAAPRPPPLPSAPQMAAYGACVQANMPDVAKGCCQKELDALAECVFAKPRHAKRR